MRSELSTARRRLAADHLAQARTLRPADLERQVGPAQALALAHVLVADVDPAEEGHLVVDEQDLAMVAAEAADEQREQAVVDPDRAAGLAQGGGDGASAARRAPAVDQDLHRHPPAGRLRQRLDEARADA